MRMTYNLNLEQSQKLIMTPELKQAIEILQYNSLELNKFIQKELMNNPVLEMIQNKGENDFNSKNESTPVEVDWKKMISNNNFKTHNNVNYDDSEENSFENYVSSETTLTEHLLFQLQFTLLSGKNKKIAKYIIQNIDNNGYLKITNKELVDKFSITDNEVENIIQIIQSFDPIGVCARSLKECLLLQLKFNSIENDIVKVIVQDYLDDLANNKISYLAKKLDVTTKAIQEAADLIKTLEPKPGRAFGSTRDVRYITPDVIVEKIDDEYVVIVKDSTAPRLYINHFYRNLILNNEVNNSTSDYINNKLNAALRIIKNIQQRRNTIYKVVKAIIKHQRDFFEKGTVYLKPLTLKEIADEIGVHESTVSRTVNDKYMQCPRGLYELKYFFQSGVSSAFGDGVSSESIKSVIKEIISNENPKKPLSDQAISNQLNKSGIKISRRTVAKYRDELNIPSSSKRRRY